VTRGKIRGILMLPVKNGSAGNDRMASRASFGERVKLGGLMDKNIKKTSHEGETAS